MNKIITSIIIAMVLMLTGCDPQVVDDDKKTDTGNPVPQGLSIESRTDTTINLVWNGVSGASGYRIHISDSEDFATETTEDLEATNYQIPGLGEGEYRYVKVSSLISGTESTASNTLKAYTALSTPVITGVTPDDDDFEICTIKWSYAGTAAAIFRVFRSDNDMSDFSFAGGTVAGTYSLADILDAGNKYYYKVVAYNDDTNSNESEIKNYTCVANAVSNYVLDDNYYDMINMSWTPNNNVNGYFIYRSPTQTGIYTQVVDIGYGSVGSSRNDGLTPGTRYYYKIAGYNIINGAKIVGAIPENKDSRQGITRPYWPQNKSAPIIESNSVTLSWSSPSTGNADGAMIYRMTTQPNSGTDITNMDYTYRITTFDNTTFTDGNVSSNMTYYYIIASYVAYLDVSAGGKAYQIGGEFDSNTATYKYLTVKTKPTAPSGFNVVMEGNTAKCSWNEPGDNVYYDYTYILQYRKSTGDWIDPPFYIYTDDTLHYDIPGLEVGGTYHFRLTNRVDGVDSSPSQIIERQAELSAPTNMNASVSSCTAVSLSWTGVTVPAAQTPYLFYRIYRDDQLLKTVSGTSTTDDTVVLADPANAYSYTVRAYLTNLDVESVDSNSSSVEFKVPTPTFIDAQCEAISGGKINLKWNISIDCDYYEISRSPTFTSDPLTISGYTNTTFQDTGLTENVNYTYTIISYKGTIPSTSDTVTRKALP